jgi:hypothetical protein
LKAFYLSLHQRKAPSKSVTRHELPALFAANGHMEKKLVNVQETVYALVAPREPLTETSGYGASFIFYMDGSLIEGFAVHQMGGGGFGHKILSPVGVFTSELSALLYC